MKTKFIKKSVSQLLLVLTITSLINIPSTFAGGFSDVNNSTPNQEAILYLQDHGVINGFSDGTFKPEKAVSRAEFLKIIIEGSHIPKDADTTILPFPDVDNSLWYLPYIKKAYAAGWITGFKDGTFKPDNTVSKVEALKILGKAQNWDLSGEKPQELSTTFSDIDTTSWYAPYISYSIKHQYVSENGPYFAPNDLMIRGSISEIIYRTLIETPASTLPEAAFTPIQYATIDQATYANINLDEALPNTFYKNEVYVVSGTITSGSYDFATIILNNENNTLDQSVVGKVINNHFDIPLYFKYSGNFYLGLVPGDGGESKSRKISVLSNLPVTTKQNATTPAAVKNIKIKYANDKTSVNFDSIDNTITKIIFNENSQTVTYLSRQKTNSIQIQYSDFSNFSSGTVKYQLSTAYLNAQKPLEISSNFSTTQDSTFNASEHTFNEIVTNQISASPADTMSSTGTISFGGKAKTDLETAAYVIKPNGLVDNVILTTGGTTTTYFGQTIIPSGNNFNFSYLASSPGRYIIEINNKNSEPSLNHPIYIGNAIPLIPDYSDLHIRTAFIGPLNLSTERTKALNLINKSRAAQGLKAVVLDQDLNTLAQTHSNDMKNNNYFSHYDLQNKTPEDRRIAMGITTSVGENIAKDTSTEFTNYDLMRSASHRQNILNPDWTRVGIGITLDGEYLLTTQEFSSSPLTSTDLQNLSIELVDKINNKRLGNGVSKFNSSSQLENISKSLNTLTINGNELTDAEFTNALDQNNFTGEAALIEREGDSWNTMLDSLLQSDTILKSTWDLIGANIQTDKTGKIYTIVTIGNSN